MSLNFNQILHQMRFKLLNSTAPTNNTPPVALPNSDQLTKTSYLKRRILAIYKSRSKAIKFTASLPLFKRKKFLIAGFTLLFISLPIAYLSLQSAKPAKAAWFDDSWAFRKAISIPSHTDSETNVFVTVPSFDATDTTKFQSDCGDLRFTKQNGELLPYYVVDCDTTATVHVQFDTLPAGASTYFMYYGNPTADNGFSSADFSAAASGLGSQTLASEEQSQGPVAYWKFDEGYGSTAYDSTKNANNGSLGVGSSAPTWQTEDQCISGKCLYFDGSNDVVTVSNTVSGIKTVSFWVKPITTSEQFIDLNGSAYIQASSGTITATDFIDPTIYVDGQVSSVIVANKWQYVTVTTGTALSGSVIKIGQISTNFGQGFIDDVKIYPYARTAAQIKSDYASRGSVKGTTTSLGASKDSSDALSQGLVGYWKMDETATPYVDSSGNGNNGTWSDNSTTTGKFGNGGSFDGTNDAVSVTDSTSLDTTQTSFTISAWIYDNDVDDGTDDDRNILSKGDVGTTANTTYLLRIQDSKYLDLRLGNGSTSQAITANTNAIPYQTWTHVTATFDGTNVILYVNGNLVKGPTANTLGSLLNAGNLAIGRQSVADCNSPYNSCWNGKIDDVRIYNRALSPKEVRDLYNWAPGPNAYYTFDEKTGASANDISGNGLTGSLGVGNSAPTWTTGKFGGALSFDGINDYVDRGTGPTQINTVSFWVKPTTTTEYPIDLNGSAYVWINGGTVTAQGFTSATIYVNGVVSSTVTAGTWQYITVTTATSLNATDLDIGRIEDVGYMEGQIDDVKIYNYARTSKQIVEDMNAGHPTGGSPVGSQVVYYKLDEGNGTSAQDSSPNNYDATLYNTPTWSNNGKFGKALDFDAASTEYLLVANTSNRIIPLGNAAFTTSMWINPDNVTPTTVKSIMTNETYTVSGFRYGINSSSKLDFWSTESGGTTALTSNTTLSAGTWYHIVMAYDGSSAKLYINGKQEASDTSASIVSNTNNLLIANAIGGKENYDGRIDEIKFYTFALTQDEILLDMNQGSAMVLGTLSDTSGLTGGSVASNSASAAYCIPGDTTSCSAPVAEWNFDEGTGGYAYDKSGNGYTGTINGATWTTGKIGKALSFDGINDYVNITGTTVTGGNYTFEFWAKPNTIHSSNSDFFIDIETGRLVLGRNASKYQFYDGSWKDFGSGIAYSSYINSWHYYTFVFNSSNTTAYLYIDGQLQGSNNTYSSKNIGGTIALMSRYDNSTYQQKGYLDQFRIYDYVRTPAQIAWDYNRGGPVGWWKLDECQGITANDASGKGNNGTITIGATGTQSVLGTCSVGVGSTAAWGNGSTGKYNSSLNFDGTDDYVTAGANPITGTSPFTLSAWMKMGSHSTYGLGAYIGTAVSGQSVWIGWTAAAQVGTPNSIGGGFYGTNYGSGITDSNWHHVVLSFAGGTNGAAILYVDGIQKVSTTYTPNLASTSVMMGKANTGTAYWYNGQIDDVRIYNYALTPTQVKSLYNENSSVRFGQ